MKTNPVWLAGIRNLKRQRDKEISLLEAEIENLCCYIGSDHTSASILEREEKSEILDKRYNEMLGFSYKQILKENIWEEVDRSFRKEQEQVKEWEQDPDFLQKMGYAMNVDPRI